VKYLPTVDALIADHDAFLIDQFGTVHDGTAPYPGAIAALRRLRAAGRRVVLLSNSGQRAETSERRLREIGIPQDSYDISITSGEVTWRLLSEGRIAVARGARRCLLLEHSPGGLPLGALGMTLVERAEDAELVVIAGSRADVMPLADYEAMLAPAARAGVPALCINPDRTMLTPNGFAPGAGCIGEIYQRLGGVVSWIGKPHPAIYEVALARLGEPARERVGGIGDSVEHDIAGARGAGCRAWLVRAGIIAGADDAAIAAECARFGAEPDGVLEAFG
jgi:HAD superfamily hydrolase (TIGR01459 family)